MKYSFSSQCESALTIRDEKLQGTHLLKSHRNKAFEILKDNGVDPRELQWKLVDSRYLDDRQVPSLVYEPSGLYFIFDLDTGEDYIVRYFPDGNKAKEYESSYTEEWDGVWEHFIVWAEILTDEVGVPDLWETVAQEKKLEESVASDDDNSLFSSDEQKQISERIIEIEQYLLKTHELSEENQKFVRDRLEYLVESSERLGKKDWKSLAFGVLLSTAMGIGLDGVQIGEVMRFVGGVLGPILGGTPLLP